MKQKIEQNLQKQKTQPENKNILFVEGSRTNMLISNKRVIQTSYLTECVNVFNTGDKFTNVDF